MPVTAAARGPLKSQDWLLPKDGVAASTDIAEKAAVKPAGRLVSVDMAVPGGIAGVLPDACAGVAAAPSACCMGDPKANTGAAGLPAFGARGGCPNAGELAPTAAEER